MELELPVLLDRVEICGSNAEPFPSASIAALIELAAYSPDSSPGSLLPSLEGFLRECRVVPDAAFSSTFQVVRSVRALKVYARTNASSPARVSCSANSRKLSQTELTIAEIPHPHRDRLFRRYSARIVREEVMSRTMAQSQFSQLRHDPIPAPCNDGGRRGRAGAEPCQPVPFLDLRPMHGPLRDASSPTSRAVIDAGAFINGPQVAAFEQRVRRVLRDARTASAWRAASTRSGSRSSPRGSSPATR